MKTIKKFTLIIYSIVICLFVKAQSDSSTFTKGLSFEASYIGDNVNNLYGGIRAGSSYLGMANIRVLFDSEKAGWWNGTKIYLNAANTHGAEPSANLIGDMQVASNIEAGNHSFIQEFWIKQSSEHYEITVGLQDLNVDFAASEYGGLYLNSSFGIIPVISANVSAPVFPLTSLGITSNWQITEKTSWLLSIYDGSPTDFDYNHYNLNWQYNSGDGILLVSEMQHSIEFKKLTGTYKLGFYSHNHLIENKFDPEFPDSLNNSIFGVYAYADQKIWKHKEKNIGAFLQFGFSPSKEALNNYYWGIGFNFAGIFSKSGSDVLGLAVAHEAFTDEIGKETAIELTYQWQLAPNFFIQPDLQYIIHPSGKSSMLKNVFVASIRFGLSI